MHLLKQLNLWYGFLNNKVKLYIKTYKIRNRNIVDWLSINTKHISWNECTSQLVKYFFYNLVIAGVWFNFLPNFLLVFWNLLEYLDYWWNIRDFPSYLYVLCVYYETWTSSPRKSWLTSETTEVRIIWYAVIQSPW